MTHAIVRVAALAVAVVVIAACSRAENRSTDSAAGLSGAQAPASQLATAQTQQRVPGPGELTKPLANYTGDELYALTQSLTYAGGEESQRNCRDLPGCGGGNPTVRTRLQVEGIVGEDSVSPTSVPQFGVIVSRGRNLGGARDAMYGMRPGNRFQYFLVVLPPAAPGGDARFQIEQLDVVGNNRQHAPLTTGTFRGCGHPFRRGARAGFYTCADTSIVRPASRSPFQGSEPPWWINCSMGCCVSDGGEQG